MTSVMTQVDPEMRALLLGAIPALRAFAFSPRRAGRRTDPARVR
jgi:hypothetical protein